MGIDVPGNSDHGVFIVRGAAQGGAEVMRERRGSVDRGQQRMDRGQQRMGRGQQRMGRAAMMGQTGAGGMAVRGRTMGRGAMMGRGQMMNRGKMMGFVQSVEGHQDISMPMNRGAGPICANCQGSTFIGGNRTAFGNVQKSCPNGCSEGDACPRCAGKDDGQGQRRIIKRVMRFDGDLDDVNLHLEHGGDFQFGESGNAKVMMIHADDFDGELPDMHLLGDIEGVGGSTADIEVRHFLGDEDGGQIGDRVFKWEMDRQDGNDKQQRNRRPSEMQFDIQIHSDGDMPIDIQRILKQVGGNHEGSGEIEIHTIIEHDGNKDEQVIEWNGDIDEIPAAIQEIIGDLEGGAIRFGGGEGHGGTILIEKIAEDDGKNKKAKAGKKKAAAKKNKKNKKDKKPDKKKAVGVEIESEATIIFGSTEGDDPDEPSIIWSGSLEEMPDHIREQFESLEYVDAEELELLGDFDEIPDEANILPQGRDLPNGQLEDSNKKKAATEKKSDKKKDNKETDKKKDDLTLNGRIVL
ncbi:MAG: hypothetical protein VX949_10950 [Planctomycetota bacterium]|nr:hypothetical protein [Planctomycetota bacterium]